MNYFFVTGTTTLSFDPKEEILKSKKRFFFSESSNLILKFAEMYPEDKFYIIGKTDLFELKRVSPLKFPKNLYSMEEIIFNKKCDLKDVSEDVFHLYDDIKFKSGLVFLHSFRGSNTSNVIKTNCKKTSKNIEDYDEEDFVKNSIYGKEYFSAQVNFINKVEKPYVGFLPDIRGGLVVKDIHNVPAKIYSQFAGKKTSMKTDVFKGNKRIIKKTHYEFEYFPIQIFAVMNEQIISPSLKRNKDVIVIQNKLSKKYNNIRGKFLNDYVFDNLINFDFYGNFEIEEKYSKYNKGIIRYKNYYQTISDYKIGVIAPFGDGFLTAKIYEYVICGVLPLVNDEYDTQNNSGLIIPEIQVKTPEMMKEKIEFYLENENERIRIVEKLQKMLPKKEDYENYVKQLKDEIDSL